MLLAILVFAKLTLFSQTNNLIVKYQMELNFGEVKQFDAILKTSNDKAVFEYSLKIHSDSIQSNIDSVGNYLFTIPDSLIYKVYTNRENKIQNEIVRAGIRQKIYFVTDTINEIKWKLTNETKTIGDFLCLKAQTTFKGRDYIVWYTPLVPSYFGPWKFYGLNGLILEVSDDKHEVNFKATNISYSKNLIKFDLINDYKKVSRKKLNKIIEEENNQFEEMLISNSSRDLKISVKISNNNSIELEN